MRISDWSSDVCSSDLRVRTFAREDHVVVAPGSDLFDEAISDEQLDYIILTIASRPDVLFYWFTKHAERQRDYLLALASYPNRSEARRVGKECVSRCRSRGSPYP